MKITILGTGYVGLVAGACFADRGNHVVCVDSDDGRVQALKNGVCPIYEPGLDDLIQRGESQGRLQFTTDTKEGVEHGEIIFIAVGTPQSEDGSADLGNVMQVAADIGQYITEYKLIATKSTVPVGTAEKIRAAIQEQLKERAVEIEFDVASNPEFLKEGAAIEDFLKPDRVIIGVDTARAENKMRELYSPGQRRQDRIVAMSPESAELTKYAANVMLATKISLMNELSSIAEATGADIESVRKGMGSDRRIGYDFIFPGCGFGGSCFPKDIHALAFLGRELDCETPILDGVLAINARQKHVLYGKMQKALGDLEGVTVALWGLSFKPNTDDMREAPSRVLMESLWSAGAKVQAYDPVAMAETRKLYPDQNDLLLCDSANEALEGADVLAVVTEWNEFRNPDFEVIGRKLAKPMIFDGRNIYSPDMLADRGISYYGIGRNKVL